MEVGMSSAMPPSSFSGGMNGASGMQRGPVPPSVSSVLSADQNSAVQETLQSLSLDQRDELKIKLDELGDKVQTENLSVEGVAESFMEILSEVSGTELDTSVTSSESSSATQPPPPPPPEGGAIPPGIMDGMSDSQVGELLELVGGLSEEDMTTLHQELEALRETAESEGLSAAEVSNSYVDILENISGEDLSDLLVNLVDTLA